MNERTVIQNTLENEEDWGEYVDLNEFRINQNEDLEIKTLDSYTSEDNTIYSFGNPELWDGDGDVFNIVVECERDYNGNITFVAPQGDEWNSSGTLRIGVVNKDEEAIPLYQKSYSKTDNKVTFSDITFSKGNIYYFSQTTSAYYQNTGSSFLEETNDLFSLLNSSDNDDEYLQTTNIVDPDGAAILRDEDKNEFLLGFGRTRFVSNSDYTDDANKVLQQACYEASSSNDPKYLILDNDLKHGYDIEGVLEDDSLISGYPTDVLSLDFVFYNGNNISSDSAEGDTSNPSLTTVAPTEDVTADADITYSNVVGIQMDGNFLQKYDCIIVQKFGTDSNTQDYLDSISSLDIGSVYLGQWGNDSDGFTRLNSVRNNPGSVTQTYNSSTSTVYMYTNQDYRSFFDYLDNNVIFTVYDNTWDDRVYADSYSGNKLGFVTLSNSTKIFGFSEIIVNELEYNENYSAEWKQNINYSSVNYMGRNYLDFDFDFTDQTTINVEISEDDTNWINYNSGDSIPFIDNWVQNGNGDFYFRVRMDTEDVEYTPLLMSFEWFVGEATALFNSINFSSAEAFRSTSDITEIQTQTFIQDTLLDKVPIPSIQTFQSNTLEARGFSGDVKGIPLDGTRKFIEWTANIDGKQRLLDTVSNIKMSYDELELDLTVSEDNIDTIRTMQKEAGNFEPFVYSNGLKGAEDTSENNNNTYKLRPSINMRPPFNIQEYVLSDYSERPSVYNAQQYDVELKFVHKNTLDNYRYVDRLERNSTEDWKIKTYEGNVYTQNINSKVIGEINSGRKIYNLELILNDIESQIFYLSLLRNGATSIIDINDGRSFVVDNTLNDTNTIFITPPDSNFEIDQGSYIVVNWEIRTTGSSSTFYVDLDVIKSTRQGSKLILVLSNTLTATSI